MRHAFLITAYNNIENLNLLLELLDDSRSQIFLHVDAKAAPLPQGAVYTPRHARLFDVPSMDVRWGDVTQIQCTLRLLGRALQEEWDYCHYITESDMPLKTVEQMDRFFTAHAGKEFVDFAPENYAFAHYKCGVYHLFPQFAAYRRSKLLKALNHGLARAQWKLGLRRAEVDYRHGSAYFSVSREFAAYVYGQRERVCRQYRYSVGGDEVWLQTLCQASVFLERVENYERQYLGNLRYIDWSRREGNSPHTFTEEDFDDLKEKADASDLCFARKFPAESPVARRLHSYLLTKVENSHASEQ